MVTDTCTGSTQPISYGRDLQKKNPNTILHTIITAANTEYTTVICGSLSAGDTARLSAELIASVDMKMACRIDFMPGGACVYAYSEPVTEKKTSPKAPIT